MLLPTAVGGSNSFGGFVWQVFFGLSLMTLPAAIGIAILRYRLWDIEVIIRRTLIYGALTTTLLLMYVGSVVVLQRIVQVLTGSTRSTIVTVISTLAIAALFQPLRHRIQKVIDRRFYRRKYDAQQTLHAFSAHLQEQTDLNQLSGDMLNVVQETLQPAHASLWLREPQHDPARSGL
jgi:hypothetical protein